MDAEISAEIARIYADAYGRVATRVRTHRRGELVVCVLEEVFAVAELVLVEGGHFEQVRLNRQAIRAETEPRIRAAVERATGSPVSTCLGQITPAGLACEICLIGIAPTPASLRDRIPLGASPRPG